MAVGRRRSAYATLAGSTAVTAVAALQSLVLLPFYLGAVGPRLYGAWLATGEVLVWLLAFDFGIPNLLIQRAGAYLAEGKKREIGAHFGASLVALGAIAVLMLSVVWLLAPWIAPQFGAFGAEGGSLVFALRVGAVATALTIVSYGAVGLSRGLQDTTLVQSVSCVGVVLGFAATALLLWNGRGLAAIAFGLLVRALATFGGCAYYVLRRVDREIVRSVRPDRVASLDIARHCPPLFAAGIGYALMNNSAVTMAALVFGPVPAAVFGVTKKLADLVRSVLDMIGHASYGGFAHLFAEGDAERTHGVWREIEASYAIVAVSLLAGYVAGNATLVANWVGPQMYGGFFLTVAVALSAGLGGWSYMQVSLLRSTGRHQTSSAILLSECGARLALMFVLSALFGVEGIALGAAATAIVSGAWAAKRTRQAIGFESVSVPWLEWRWRVVPVAAALVVGWFGALGGWFVAVLVGGLFCSVSLALLYTTDPVLAQRRRATPTDQAREAA